MGKKGKKGKIKGPGKPTHNIRFECTSCGLGETTKGTQQDLFKYLNRRNRCPRCGAGGVNIQQEPIHEQSKVEK